MSEIQHWHTGYTQELAQAQTARLAGNEGMARVCARRAAGIIIAEYLQRRGENHHSSSALQQLKQMQSTPDLAPRTKEVVGHFLQPVDKDHRLPPDVDLLSEAYWLAQTLLGEK
jgi:hypothetical protein